MGKWRWKDDDEGSIGLQDGYVYAEITTDEGDAFIRLHIGTEDGLTLEMAKAAIEALFAQVEASRKEGK